MKEESIKIATVVHRSDGWHVISEKGKNLGGPYKSKAEAEKRLRQVEYFKHNGGLMNEKVGEYFNEEEGLIDTAIKLLKSNGGNFSDNQIKHIVNKLYQLGIYEPYKEIERAYFSNDVIAAKKIGVEVSPPASISAVPTSQPITYTDDMLKGKSISEIARIIADDWKNVNYAAKPYLEAMGSLNSIDDNYFMDSGYSVVAYFLANSAAWRGDVARVVKRYLKKMLDQHYKFHRGSYHDVFGAKIGSVNPAGDYKYGIWVYRVDDSGETTFVKGSDRWFKADIEVNAGFKEIVKRYHVKTGSFYIEMMSKDSETNDFTILGSTACIGDKAASIVIDKIGRPFGIHPEVKIASIKTALIPEDSPKGETIPGAPGGGKGRWDNDMQDANPTEVEPGDEPEETDEGDGGWTVPPGAGGGDGGGDGFNDMSEEAQRRVMSPPEILRKFSPQDLQAFQRLEKNLLTALQTNNTSFVLQVEKQMQDLVNRYTLGEPVEPLSDRGFIARMMVGHLALRRSMIPVLKTASSAIYAIMRNFPVVVKSVSLGSVHSGDYSANPEEGQVEWIVALKRMGMPLYSKVAIIKVVVKGDKTYLKPTIWDVHGKTYPLDSDGIDDFFGMKFQEDIENIENAYLDEEKEIRKKNKMPDSALVMGRRPTTAPISGYGGGDQQ